MVRACPQERRDRWEARRCGRRRFSPVLHGGASPIASRYAEGWARGSALQVRFRGDEGPARMSLSVAILAGGLATRLRPITERIPKSLVEVAGKPFAAHQVELLRRHGLTDIVFLVGHLGDMLRDVLGDGSALGVRLQYVFDGSVALGTGGPIRQALPVLSDPFFVLYGDSYLECDYLAIEKTFLASAKNGLMAVYRNDNQWDRSNVLFEDGSIIRYDKRPTPD